MIPYIGGKSRLANWIISNFPDDYQNRGYCEVFGGGAWVLFKKDISRIETYNDLNKNLVNLFRVIRDNFDEFEHMAKWTLHSREMFEEAKEKLKDDKYLTRIERAVNYCITKAQGFSGQSSFGYSVSAKTMFTGKWLPFIKRMEHINARLKKVQIECLQYEKCIEKYDSKNTIFYLDPPYVNCEYYYNVNGVCFSYKDHKRLASLLRRIKGQFIISYYDHPMIKQFYKRYHIIFKNTVKSACGVTKIYHKKKPKATELLIMNY